MPHSALHWIEPLPCRSCGSPTHGLYCERCIHLIVSNPRACFSVAIIPVNPSPCRRCAA